MSLEDVKTVEVWVEVLSKKKFHVMTCPYCCSNCKKNKDTIKPFLIARWPVTKYQYSLGNPAKKGLDLPATGLDFETVKTAVNLDHQRLPTAKEWEYAFRAGTKTRFPWGDEFDSSYVWYAGNSGYSHEQWQIRMEGFGSFRRNMIPVSHSPIEHDQAKKWNAFGLVDMIGNVSEFLSDGFVIGGGYNHTENALYTSPVEVNGHDTTDIGFRPALSIPGV